MVSRFMDNVKNDAYYASKILKDIKFILEKTAGLSAFAFKSDDVLCDSVLFRLDQIAESSEKLTPAYKKARSIIPWQAIKGMRNSVVHEYDDNEFGDEFDDPLACEPDDEMDVLYQTVTKDLPQIYKLLEALI